MLQKSKSKQIKLFKYALLIPIVFGMLIYTSCAKEEMQNSSNELSILQQLETLRESIKVNNGNLTDEEKNSLHALLEEMNQITSQTKRVSHFKIDSSGAVVGVQDQVEVPFAVIEQVPVFPGCEDLASNDEKKRCMSDKIQEFVSRNFNTDLATSLGLVGRQRITVMFKIDAEGNIVGIQSRAPHAGLEAEAIRVIELLPKMVPGKQRGKNVTVPYSLPIVFVVQD